MGEPGGLLPAFVDRVLRTVDKVVAEAEDEAKVVLNWMFNDVDWSKASGAAVTVRTLCAGAALAWKKYRESKGKYDADDINLMRSIHQAYSCVLCLRTRGT